MGRDSIIDVWVNVQSGGRKKVSAELLKDNKATILVMLPDGNIIKRKKKRDLV